MPKLKKLKESKLPKRFGWLRKGGKRDSSALFTVGAQFLQMRKLIAGRIIGNSSRERIPFACVDKRRGD